MDSQTSGALPIDNQQATNQNVIEKLKKLLAHQKSAERIGSQAEAAAFATKVQDLLIGHKLTMSQIEMDEQERDEPISKEYVYASDLGFDRLRKRVEWMERLASAVARNFFCRILIVEGSNTLVFVGRESDRQAVIQMYSHLAQIAIELADHELKAWKKSGGLEEDTDDAFNDFGQLRSDAVRSRIFKRSFLDGFVLAISQRLYSNRKVIESKAALMPAKNDGSAALVLLNRQEDAIANYMKKAEDEGSVGKSARSLGGSTFNAAGHARGKARGREVSLESRARLGGGK